MIASHLPRSTAKLVDCVAFARASPASDSITKPAEGEADQPFCGAEISTSTPASLHVDPGAARGDAVEYEKPADPVHRVGHGTQVVVGQDHARGGLDMRGENDLRSFFGYPRRDLLDRGRGKGRLGTVAGAPRLHHGFRRRDRARLEYLAPAIGKPAVADHQRLRVRRQLPRHGLHRVGAAARHDGHCLGIIDLAQHRRDIAHHALEFGAHVVERPVSEDDGIFQQAIGVDCVKQGGHLAAPSKALRKT